MATYFRFKEGESSWLDTSWWNLRDENLQGDFSDILN